MNNQGSEIISDRESELKALDDSKIGVKGLVDSGISRVPKIFINPQIQNAEVGTKSEAGRVGCDKINIPVIDFEGIDEDARLRGEIVDQVRNACEQWGFFQVINHAISPATLDDMIDGIRRFHEQEPEIKKQFYTRDLTRKVIYNTNYDLYQSSAANWRDSLSCVMAPHQPDPQELPAVCRDVMIEYSNNMMRFAQTVIELISEALGLDSNHLKEMDVIEGFNLIGHYYPPCPDPDLTLGFTQHTDIGFLTVLLQDQIGGLQVLHQEQWIDVTPVPGSLIVNIGDLTQLVTNDKFKSVYHRVLAKKAGPRVSVGCFFRPNYIDENHSTVYSPIKELKSTPIYRETTIKDFLNYIHSNGLFVGPGRLEYLKL